MHRRSHFLRRSCALLTFALALASRVGSAAPTPASEAELTVARERFAAGRRLEDAGRWAEALEVFQKVAAVKLTPQVRFHMALCLENIGLWTRALDGFARAAAEATGVAPEVVKEANEHLRKLESTMPTVSIHIRGALAGDELFLDGHKLPADTEPLPVRTDPGPHCAEVKRNSEVVARGYFALDPKGTRWIELVVGTLAREGEPGPRPRPQDREPERPQNEAGGLERTIGWVSIAVGGSAAVATGVFIGLRQDALSRLNSACPGLKACPSNVRSIVRDGDRDATLVNVLATVAAVTTAGGALLVLTATPTRPERTTTAVIEAGPLWIGLRGTF